MESPAVWISAYSALLLLGFLTVGTQALGPIYNYGTNSGDEKISVGGDGQECIDFPKVRIMNSLNSTSVSLSDHLTGGKLCISPNGGVAFSETAIPQPFDTVTPGPTQEAAILPMYQDYDDGFNLNDQLATTGLFYSVITDSNTINGYVNDISSCSLLTNAFEPFWAVRITWGNMWPKGGLGLFDPVPTPSNTFQVVILGNAGDAIFVIVNYHKISISGSEQALIQGDADASKVYTFPFTPSDNASNCATTPGRSVFYISDDPIVIPTGSYACSDSNNCGRYGDLVSTGAGSSGSCNSSVCTCNTGHTGIYCLNDDSNDCDPDLCDAAHSYLCEDTGLLATADPTIGYKCHCDFGYTGANCSDEIQACDSNPCQNGGACTNVPYDFQCTCPDGWQGTLCDEDIDECITDDPCTNGGTCLNSAGSYSCICADTFTGDHCECGGWGPWSKCERQRDEKGNLFDSTCGGCGTQYRTRTCDTGDATWEERDCNVRCCKKSIYTEKTEKSYTVRDGKVITVVRPRFCCYKFPAGVSPRKISKKRCEYVKNGLC